MSGIEVTVRRIESIEEHPDADKLEIANIAGTSYQSCVSIGKYNAGDLVAYIPPDALVPEGVQEELGVKGYLAGADKNRVRSIRLRGVLSQGLLYPAEDSWEEGQNVADLLGIEKYEPPIPTQLAGQVYQSIRQCCINYDIQNLRNHPDVFEDGEEVVMTEKLHGTFSQFGLVSDGYADPDYGPFVVGSKGLLKKRQPFKPDAEANENNLYLRTAEEYRIREKLEAFRADIEEDTVFVLGEVFGETVQDLGYGADVQNDEMGFRVFDCYVGPYLDGRYLDHDELGEFCETYGFDRVPVIYKGPYSEEEAWKHASGAETISGDEKHIREGVVIRPVEERWNTELGRIQLKAKSPEYVTRNGGTEYR